MMILCKVIFWEGGPSSVSLLQDQGSPMRVRINIMIGVDVIETIVIFFIIIFRFHLQNQLSLSLTK